MPVPKYPWGPLYLRSVARRSRPRLVPEEGLGCRSGRWQPRRSIYRGPAIAGCDLVFADPLWRNGVRLLAFRRHRHRHSSACPNRLSTRAYIPRQARFRVRARASRKIRRLRKTLRWRLATFRCPTGVGAELPLCCYPLPPSQISCACTSHRCGACNNSVAAAAEPACTPSRGRSRAQDPNWYTATLHLGSRTAMRPPSTGMRNWSPWAVHEPSHSTLLRLYRMPSSD